MKFNKHQKEIIKKIAYGEIYDIVSYLKVFNLTTFQKYDSQSIEEKMREKENGTKYKKLKDGVQTFSLLTYTNNDFLPHTEFTPYIPKDNDFEFVEAKISYTFAKKSIKLPNDTEYTFNLLDGVNCTNSFSNIKDFLTIWQYLKHENLVLEVNKAVKKEDYEVFFEYIPIEQTSYMQSKANKKTKINNESNNLSPINNLSSFMHCDYDHIKDFRDYTDFHIEYNKSNEIVCNQFIDKQIIGNADLELFIKQKYRTREQIANILNLIPAYLALVITLFFTIFQEIRNSTEMEQLISSVSSIESQLIELTNTNMDLNTIYEPSTSSGLSTSLDSNTNLDSSTSLDANTLPN